jgi:hypothetical protein
LRARDDEISSLKGVRGETGAIAAESPSLGFPDAAETAGRDIFKKRVQREALDTLYWFS